MSDQPQGTGWWQASDGKWYPPSQAPQPPTAPPPPPTGPSPAGPPMGVPQPGMAYPAGTFPPGYAPRRQGMSGCAKAALVVLVLGLLLGGGCVVALLVWGDDIVDNVEQSRVNGRRDTTIATCEVADDGFAIAEVRFRNSSSGRSNYSATIEFTVGGGRVGLEPVTVFASDVAPGETVVRTARSLAAAGDDDVDCRLAEAIRFSAEFDD